MQARDFEPPRAYARQLLKDMKAVSVFAKEQKLDLALIEEAVHIYSNYVALGHEMTDAAAVVKLYEGKARQISGKS